MKYIFCSVLTIVAMSFCAISCKDKVVQDIEHPLSNKFEHIDTVHAESLSFGVVPDEWMLTDHQLVCKTENGDALYAAFDRSTLQPTGSFGRKGNGHMEWNMPHAVDAGAGALTVIDNASRKQYMVKENAVSEIGDCKLQDVVNDAKTIAYPIVGYVALSPKGQKLVVANLLKGTRTDSVYVEAKDGKSAMLDFSWTHTDRHLILAFQYANRFVLCTTDAEGHITSKDVYDGGGKSQQDKVFFTDVACGDYLYLLSQKQVNVNTGEGHSEIEVYDYEGKPVKKMVLDFIAFKMLIDKDGQRLLMTSPADENLHVVKL